MGYLFYAIGLLLLVVGFVAFVQNMRAALTASAPAKWLRLYWWHWLALPVLGIVAYYFTWSTTGLDGERVQIVGFPFPAAALDSHGADYVGPLTLPSLFANAVVWALLPDICLCVWRLAVSRRNLTTGA
jgi:hypothetical protein